MSDYQMNSLPRVIVTFLQSLSRTQSELLELQDRKRFILLNDPGKISEHHDREAEIHQKLNELLSIRERLLQFAHSQGSKASTLRDLCREQKWLNQPELSGLLNETHAQARQLRQESWSMWVMSHRAAKHYAESLNVIASNGERVETYLDRTPTSQSGGSLIDASA